MKTKIEKLQEKLDNLRLDYENKGIELDKIEKSISGGVYYNDLFLGHTTGRAIDLFRDSIGNYIVGHNLIKSAIKRQQESIDFCKEEGIENPRNDFKK